MSFAVFSCHITIHFSVRLCFVCCLNSKDADNYCVSDDCSICWLFSTNFLHPFTLFPVSCSLLNGKIQAFTWHTGYSILFVLHSLRLFANIASRSVSNNHWILLIRGPKISHRSESLYHVSISSIFFCLALNKDHSINFSVSYKFMGIVWRFAKSCFSTFDD